MSDNIYVLDATSVQKLLATKELSGEIHVPKHVLVGEDGSPVGVDAVGGAIVTVTLPHHEAHEGDGYNAWAYDLDLDGADELIIAFKIPDTAKRKHLRVFADCSSGALLEILQDPTITAGSGTQIPIFNQDEDSSNTSELTDIDDVANKMTKNPTITADGTVVYGKALSSGKQKSVGTSRGNDEKLCKTNSVRAVRITGIEDNGAANILLAWYEHTDSN